MKAKLSNVQTLFNYAGSANGKGEHRILEM